VTKLKFFLSCPEDMKVNENRVQYCSAEKAKAMQDYWSRVDM